ncbi:hypothetical protein TNCV_4214471 [Trichonephila clavipes]|nr:hypothetical protein TNCV_4214471 [Trichonephila clavipes]
MLPHRQRLDQGPRKSSWKKATCTPVVIRSFKHHTGDSTISFVLFSPQFREDTLEVVKGSPLLFFFHQLHERGLTGRRLFRIPPCNEGIISLQAFMSSVGFEPRP